MPERKTAKKDTQRSAKSTTATANATFGFNDTANLDKGAMWPVAFALKELTAADEAKIAALVKKAAG